MQVARGTTRPTQAMPWINEIEKAKTLETLPFFFLIFEATHGDFETLTRQ